MDYIDTLRITGNLSTVDIDAYLRENPKATLNDYRESILQKEAAYRDKIDSDNEKRRELLISLSGKCFKVTLNPQTIIFFQLPDDFGYNYDKIYDNKKSISNVIEFCNKSDYTHIAICEKFIKEKYFRENNVGFKYEEITESSFILLCDVVSNSSRFLQMFSK